MTHVRYLFACLAAVMAVSALADDAARANNAPKRDALTGVVDPYDAVDQKVKFFKVTGKVNEIDAKAFEPDRKAGDNLIMPFEKWETAAAFDKNRNGSLDWFEFDAYRQAMRKAVLATCDKNKDNKLTGDERTAALKWLTNNKLLIKPDAPRPIAVPRAEPADLGTTSAPAEDDEDYSPEQWREEYLSEIDEAATLSAEQKQALRDVLDLNDKEHEEFYSKLDMERLRELSRLVYYDPTEGDTREKFEAAEAAGKELGEARDAAAALWKKQQARLMAVLTAEQLESWRMAQLVNQAHAIIQPAELDDEQIWKFKAALADQVKRLKTFDLFVGYAIGNVDFSLDTGIDFWPRLERTALSLLTREQKDMLAWRHAHDGATYEFWPIELTDEQTRELKAAYEELKQSAAASLVKSNARFSEKVAGLLSGAMSEESSNKLRDKAFSLLTDDQRDAILKKQLATRFGYVEADFDATLSDEQKNELKTLRETANRNIEEQQFFDRATLESLSKPFEPFVGALTPEQKDAMVRSLTRLPPGTVFR